MAGCTNKVLISKPLQGVIATVLLMLFLASGALSEDSCVTCHGQLAGRLGQPARLFQDDVHRQVGFSCVFCHGGDPSATREDHAHDSLRIPDFGEITDRCGSCHSSADFMKQFNPSLRIDQVSEYQTSVHGQLSAKGNTQVANCISCHSVHDIRRLSDPLSPVHPLRVADTCGECHSDRERIGPYGIRHDQVFRYKQSVHAAALYKKGDLSAATCNDCHGSHGAIPPEVTSIAEICGTCHESQHQLFKQSPHYEVFRKVGLSGCTTCHGNHDVVTADESLLEGIGSVCSSSCHDSDEGRKAAQQMKVVITALSQHLDLAEKSLSEATRAGVEVDSAIGDLHQARERLALARIQVHLLDVETVSITVQKGLKIADTSYRQGVRAWEDLRSRHRSFQLLLAAVMIAVIGGGALLVQLMGIRRQKTEALQLERERIALSRERLASVGEIFAGVAHTVRNPLHGLLNCVDILRAKVSPDDQIQKTLALMSEGLQRIESITRRLLVLTRRTPLQKVSTDINALIRETLQFIEVRSHKSGVEIQTTLNKVPTVEIDPNQFSEALLSVLNNALDACQGGGAVSVRTFVASSSAEFVCVEISDTGAGISAEHLSRIFHPFFTTKAVGEGTGLGLAITRRIVEEHGGTLSVESEVGNGTSVSFRIPVRQ